MSPCRAGDTGHAEPPGNGQWQPDHDQSNQLHCCRMLVVKSLYHCPVDKRGHSGEGRRLPGVIEKQPSQLRTYRHRTQYPGYADASERYVMNLDYPFHVDGRGRTATTEDDEHIRDLIEQVLFTSPGERLNRPTFGSGLLQLVFEPSGEPLATATQMIVQGALQQWLGELIHVEAIQVESRESTLEVTVQYTVRRTQKQVVVKFSRARVEP